MLKKRLLVLTSAVLLFTGAAMAQAKLVQKVTKKGSELVIPYEKYELPNGLTLIVHEDKSDPVVHVDVTYHVGSSREQIGKSGFAHFFEHLMFEGTEHIGRGEYMKIIQSSGGGLNANTSLKSEFTNSLYSSEAKM